MLLWRQVVERLGFGQEGGGQGHIPVSNICSINARRVVVLPQPAIRTSARTV